MFLKFIQVSICRPGSFFQHMHISQLIPVGGLFRLLETTVHFSLCTSVSIPLKQIDTQQIIWVSVCTLGFCIFQRGFATIHVMLPTEDTISTPLAKTAHLFLPSEHVKYCTSDLTCVCFPFIASEVVYIFICVFAICMSSLMSFL